MGKAGRERDHIAQLLRRDIARTRPPDDADRFALAERHHDEMSRHHRHAFRDSIVVAIAERQGQQDLDRVFHRV
jgi:hypothetical protein